MATTSPLTLTDAAKLLERLDPDDIEQRIRDLDAELKSLKVLLRSLRARTAARRRQEGGKR
jgi:hypothetical protein